MCRFFLFFLELSAHTRSFTTRVRELFKGAAARSNDISVYDGPGTLREIYLTFKRFEILPYRKEDKLFVAVVFRREFISPVTFPLLTRLVLLTPNRRGGTTTGTGRGPRYPNERTDVRRRLWRRGEFSGSEFSPGVFIIFITIITIIIVPTDTE